VVVAFMRYIDVLSRIGRVSHTIATVERVTQAALLQAMRRPLAGAVIAASADADARPVLAQGTGHVQFIDIEALHQLAQRLDGQVHVGAHVGDLVHPRAPLAWLRAPDNAADEASLADLRQAFVIGPERSIEQDPAYGLIVLAEIAERALSPAVNDPGTAIAVIGSQVRLMIAGLAEAPDLDAPRFDRVSTPAAQPEALVALALEPIARCAANQPEVMLQLLHHLDALCSNAPPSFGVAARALVQRALARAERGGADREDLARWHNEASRRGLLDGGAR